MVMTDECSREIIMIILIMVWRHMITKRLLDVDSSSSLWRVSTFVSSTTRMVVHQVMRMLIFPVMRKLRKPWEETRLWCVSHHPVTASYSGYCRSMSSVCLWHKWKFNIFSTFMSISSMVLESIADVCGENARVRLGLMSFCVVACAFLSSTVLSV